MLDREKIMAVLKHRFPGATPEQVGAAANALVGLDDEWVEIQVPADRAATMCADSCWLRRVLHGRDLKLFSRTFTH